MGNPRGLLWSGRRTVSEKLIIFYSGHGLFANPTVDGKRQEIYFISNDANLFRLDMGENRENPFIWSYNFLNFLLLYIIFLLSYFKFFSLSYGTLSP